MTYRYKYPKRWQPIQHRFGWPNVPRKRYFDHLDTIDSIVHPNNPVSWREYLATRCQFNGKKRGVAWYNESNCHFFVFYGRYVKNDVYGYNGRAFYNWVTSPHGLVTWAARTHHLRVRIARLLGKNIRKGEQVG